MKTAIATLLVSSLLFVVPAYAQTNEVTVSITAAQADVNNVYTYDVYGVALEGARYINNGLIGVTGELSFSTGTGILPAFTPSNMEQRMMMALAGVRVRYPIGRFTPSVHVAGGLMNLTLDQRRQNSGIHNIDLFTKVIGGALAFRISDEASIRVQPAVFFFEGFETQLRVAVGGVFAW